MLHKLQATGNKLEKIYMKHEIVNRKKNCNKMKIMEDKLNENVKKYIYTKTYRKQMRE